MRLAASDPRPPRKACNGRAAKTSLEVPYAPTRRDDAGAGGNADGAECLNDRLLLLQEKPRMGGGARR